MSQSVNTLQSLTPSDAAAAAGVSSTGAAAAAAVRAWGKHSGCVVVVVVAAAASAVLLLLLQPPGVVWCGVCVNAHVAMLSQRASVCDVFVCVCGSVCECVCALHLCAFCCCRVAVAVVRAHALLSELEVAGGVWVPCCCCSCCVYVRMVSKGGTVSVLFAASIYPSIYT